MGKTIQTNVLDILTNKLKSIFIQIGDVFNEGLINPMEALFVGIGKIFVQLFNILKEIGDKIVSLPSCMFTYTFQETLNIMDAIYRRVVFKFLQDIFSTIYEYTLKYVFDFIGYITGYNDSVKKCYGFNVSTEVSKMNSNLKDIESAFKKGFGKMDFSQIRV